MRYCIELNKNALNYYGLHAYIGAVTDAFVTIDFAHLVKIMDSMKKTIARI